MEAKMPERSSIRPSKVIRLVTKKTEQIAIETRCDDCKKHIENIVSSIAGVQKVMFLKNSDLLEITYNASKISLEDVEIVIAGYGYNTPHHKAKVEFYTDAPKCCKFARIEARV